MPVTMTTALADALRQVADDSGRNDLMYLECWERLPLPGPAAALRVVQLRRANPDLARCIRAEIAAGR